MLVGARPAVVGAVVGAARVGFVSVRVVVAGLAFGVVEKFVEGYISTAAREIVGFSIAILVLLVYPQGLFGKREVFKV